MPPFFRYVKPRWHSRGLTERQERVFNVLAGLFIVVMMTGWTIAIIDEYHLRHPAFSAPPGPGPKSAASLPAPPAAPVTGRVADAIINPGTRAPSTLTTPRSAFSRPCMDTVGKSTQFSAHPAVRSLTNRKTFTPRRN